jgi:hypothetical protein
MFSLSSNNPFKNMKGLEILDLSANKLNTFHKNSLPDNIVHGLKTINLASNPYICNCSLIWYRRSVPNIRIAVSESDGTLLYDRTSV